MPRDDLAKYVAEVRRQREVSSFIKLIALESGPVSINLTAAHAVAQHHHRVCVPVVRATGGLADTVQHGVTGFSFAPYDPAAFEQTLRLAVRTWRDRSAWRELQRRAMATDF